MVISNHSFNFHYCNYFRIYPWNPVTCIIFISLFYLSRALEASYQSIYI